jgi:hypothetical protein
VVEEAQQLGTWRAPPPLRAWAGQAFEPAYSGYVPHGAGADAWAGWDAYGGMVAESGDSADAGAGAGAGAGEAAGFVGSPKRLLPIDPAAYNEYDSQWSGWAGYRAGEGEEGGKPVATDALWRWNVHTEVWERVDSAGVVLQVRAWVCCFVWVCCVLTGAVAPW